jgi:uncharacterized protein YkwD
MSRFSLEPAGEIVKGARMPALARVALASLVAALVLALAPPAAPKSPTRVELAVLHAINAARVRHGLAGVRLSRPLQKRTRRHALWLIRTDRFVHGVVAPNVRENLAFGNRRALGPRGITLAWLRSPGHRATLLWPAARRAGVGVVRGTYFGYGDMAVAVARLAR